MESPFWFQWVHRQVEQHTNPQLSSLVQGQPVHILPVKVVSLSGQVARKVSWADAVLRVTLVEQCVQAQMA
jgi:hypothetical protein